MRIICRCVLWSTANLNICTFFLPLSPVVFDRKVEIGGRVVGKREVYDQEINHKINSKTAVIN